MTPSIRKILAPLAPHWDRILRQPMSRKAVDDLAKKVGLRMPAPLRDYLLEVGLFQDLTGWDVSPIEVYDPVEEFVDARWFLCDLLPPKGQDLFPFGDDGAGNVFCLPTPPGAPCRIHFVDHETRKVSRQKEFTAWLQTVVAKVMRGIRRRVPNDRKVWAVQFTFSNTAYADLVKVMRSAGKFKEIDRGWSKPDKSTPGMIATERRIELNGERMTLRQLECRDWEGPLLSFDMSEPLRNGLEHSKVKALDRLCKGKCPGYALVDYGPLDETEIEDDEGEE